MALSKDISRIANPPAGDGHDITNRYMTATELAEILNDMLLRQQAYEDRRTQNHQKAPPPIAGCVFIKSCTLPYGLIDYSNPSGLSPTSTISDYGGFTLLGGRDTYEEGLDRDSNPFLIARRPLPAIESDVLGCSSWRYTAYSGSDIVLNLP